MMDTSKIDERARSINLLRVLLTAIAAVFFALGWAARFVFAFFGLVLRWSLAAVAVGWETRKGIEK